MNLAGLRLYNAWLRLRLKGRRLGELAQVNLSALSGLKATTPIEELSFVVVDLETTGLDPNKDRVVSVGAFRVEGGAVMLGSCFDRLCHPGRDIPVESIEVHAILPDMIADAPPAWEVFDDFLAFLGHDLMVAHHAIFDLHFINWVMRERHGFRLQNIVLDTVLMCRHALLVPDPYGIRRGAKRCSLDHLAQLFEIQVPERHTALGDALATSLILQRLLLALKEQGWSSLGDLVKLASVW